MSCLVSCLIFPTLHNISAYMSSSLTYQMYYWYITRLCRLLGILFPQKFRLPSIQTYWSNLHRILLPGLGRRHRHRSKKTVFLLEHYFGIRFIPEGILSNSYQKETENRYDAGKNAMSFLLRKVWKGEIFSPMFFIFAYFSLRKIQENQEALYCLK
jgi:hypothetical protein